LRRLRWEVPKMCNEHFTGHYGFVVDYLAEALRVSTMYRQAATQRHLDVGRAAAEARSRRESAKRHRRQI
jgi:ATP-dependent Lon protease